MAWSAGSTAPTAGGEVWRRVLVATLTLAPHVMAAAELIVGAGLMALGLLWLVWRARP